jgi:hypothetical protein
MLLGRVRYKAAVGKLGRVVAARLLPGTDIVEGIEKVCDDYEIQYAFIGCSIGSLKKATFMYVVPKPEAKVNAAYSDPLEIPGPIEFLGGFGVICEGEDGERLTHFHGTVSDRLDHVYGGHFLKGKNPILVTMDLVIVGVEGVRFLRRYDSETDLVNFSPEPRCLNHNSR